jgi:hypothetical protein
VNISKVDKPGSPQKLTMDLMVLGRVNAFSQMLRNSVRKLFFSEFSGSLGED